MIQIKPWQDLSQEEVYDLLRLRIAVFVVEQNCPYQDADNKDKSSLHVMMRNEEGHLVGCARLVQPGISYAEWSIGRVAIHPFARNQGKGQEIMNACLAHLKRQTTSQPVRISAQFYLLRFYTNLGFVQVSDIYLEDNIPHIEMLLTDYQAIKAE
jgi:ElaA protein